MLLLLLALLSPQAMDEFDVFMDAINRRIATQTLLEFAREKGHLQFIFLTPQVRGQTQSFLYANKKCL
jgi:chromosome segregation ATPase